MKKKLWPKIDNCSANQMRNVDDELQRGRVALGSEIEMWKIHIGKLLCISFLLLLCFVVLFGVDNIVSKTFSLKFIYICVLTTYRQVFCCCCCCLVNNKNHINFNTCQQFYQFHLSQCFMQEVLSFFCCALFSPSPFMCVIRMELYSEFSILLQDFSE